MGAGADKETSLLDDDMCCTDFGRRRQLLPIRCSILGCGDEEEEEATAAVRSLLFVRLLVRSKDPGWARDRDRGAGRQARSE